MFLQIDQWYDVWRVHHQGQDGERMFAYVRFVKQDTLDSVFLLLDVPGFENLSSLDISNCITLDPSTLTEVSVVLGSLTAFRFRGCKQISQYHLSKIVDNCRQLIEIDGTGAGTVSSTFAIAIICRIPNVKIFWVRPRLDDDLKRWSLIVSQYRRVNFGLEVNSYVPGPGYLERFLESLPELHF